MWPVRSLRPPRSSPSRTIRPRTSGRPLAGPLGPIPTEPLEGLGEALMHVGQIAMAALLLAGCDSGESHPDDSDDTGWNDTGPGETAQDDTGATTCPTFTLVDGPGPAAEVGPLAPVRLALGGVDWRGIEILLVDEGSEGASLAGRSTGKVSSGRIGRSELQADLRRGTVQSQFVTRSRDRPARGRGIGRSGASRPGPRSLWINRELCDISRSFLK